MAHFRDGEFPQDPFAPQFGSWLSSAVSAVKNVVKPVVSVASTVASTAVKTAAATAVLVPTSLAFKGATSVLSRVAPKSPFFQTANAIGSAALGASAGLVPGGSTVVNAVMPTAQPAQPIAVAASRSDYPGGVNPFLQPGKGPVEYYPTGKSPSGWTRFSLPGAPPVPPGAMINTAQPAPTAQPAAPTAVAQPAPTPTPPSAPTPYVPPSYTPPDTSAVATAQPAEPTTVAVPSPAAVAPATSGGGGGAILAGAGAGFLVGGPVGALVGGGIAAYLGKKS